MKSSCKSPSSAPVLPRPPTDDLVPVGLSDSTFPSSSNTAPDLTSRLGPTNTYEVKPYRFFESLDIALYDCGGQRGFVEGYLTPDEAGTLFPFTAALIYVFEVRKLNNAEQPLPESVATFRRVLNALLQHSPKARIFILIHKMDILNNDERPILFGKWVDTVKETCQNTPVVIFASSIYEDSLFRVCDLHRASLPSQMHFLQAWSTIVRALVPNLAEISRALTILSRACGAIEAVLFEKGSFLMVARSDDQTNIFDDPFVVTNNPETRLMVTYTLPDNLPPAPTASDELVPNRYEQVSQLIKAFQNNLKKHSQETFKTLHMDMEHFTIVLDSITPNSCILILIGDTRIRKSLLW